MAQHPETRGEAAKPIRGRIGGADDGAARRRARDVALGRRPPDLVVRNARLVNVYSGEILDGYQVATSGDLVAWVGPEADAEGFYRGRDFAAGTGGARADTAATAAEGTAAAEDSLAGTEVIDADGAYLVPGFIDVHGHADFLSNPVALAEAVLPHGTTTIMTDTHDSGASLGPEALDLLLETTRDIPFRYFFTLPLTAPAFPDLEGGDLFTLEAIEEYLDDPLVLATSEITAWSRLLDGDEELLEKLERVRGAGLRVEGHMAGCSSDRIQALGALGLTSCHESIKGEHVLARVRLGVGTVIRHGSIRADITALREALEARPDLDTSRIMLSPDWMSPMDVVAHGYLDHVVSEAIAAGAPAVKAVQMATINPATYLGLDHVLGGVAPGRKADFFLTGGIEHIEPDLVVFAGRVAARQGRNLQSEAYPSFPSVPVEKWAPHRRIPRPVVPGDLEITAGGSMPGLRYENKTITRLIDVELPVIGKDVSHTGGRAEGDDAGLLLLSIWSGIKGRWITVPLGGFGARVGGLATSLAHDTHVPLVLGSNPEDMATAVERMLDVGGGYVLVDSGEVTKEVPLACGGAMYPGSVAGIAVLIQDLNDHLRERGCPFDDPVFALGFLAFTGLPFARLTPSGLLDVRNNEIVYQG